MKLGFFVFIGCLLSKSLFAVTFLGIGAKDPVLQSIRVLEDGHVELTFRLEALRRSTDDSNPNLKIVQLIDNDGVATLKTVLSLLNQDAFNQLKAGKKSWDSIVNQPVAHWDQFKGILRYALKKTFKTYQAAPDYRKQFLELAAAFRQFHAIDLSGKIPTHAELNEMGGKWVDQNAPNHSYSKIHLVENSINNPVGFILSDLPAALSPKMHVYHPQFKRLEFALNVVQGPIPELFVEKLSVAQFFDVPETEIRQDWTTPPRPSLKPSDLKIQHAYYNAKLERYLIVAQVPGDAYESYFWSDGKLTHFQELDYHSRTRHGYSEDGKVQHRILPAPLPEDPAHAVVIEIKNDARSLTLKSGLRNAKPIEFKKLQEGHAALEKISSGFQDGSISVDAVPRHGFTPKYLLYAPRLDLYVYLEAPSRQFKAPEDPYTEEGWRCFVGRPREWMMFLELVVDKPAGIGGRREFRLPSLFLSVEEAHPYDGTNLKSVYMEGPGGNIVQTLPLNEQAMGLLNIDPSRVRPLPAPAAKTCEDFLTAVTKKGWFQRLFGSL